MSDETSFTAAWQNPATTLITLDTDITLTCASGAPFRNSPTNITVEGNGHTLRQICANSQVVSSHGTGSVTFDNITSREATRQRWETAVRH